MKKEFTDEELIAFIEGEENTELASAIEIDDVLKARFLEIGELHSAIEESAEIEVPEQIRSNFSQAIEEELYDKSNQRSGVSWGQLAAAVAMLLIGFGVGKFSGENYPAEELIGLKNEINQLKQVTLTNTLQHHTASERIMAVNQIEEAVNINEKLVFTLVNTLNNDESPNVRYEALQALNKYINNESVKAALVKSLESQQDPLIQMSLISILVEAEEQSAIKPLKELIKKENIMPEVKKQARIALQVLA